MEPRSNDRGWRAEDPHITSNTIFYQFEAAKLPKAARRVVQNLYGPPSVGVQKLYRPGYLNKRYKIQDTRTLENIISFIK